MELDGYGISSIGQHSGCELEFGMMVCCFDAEYVSLLNVLHALNFFPSINTLEIHRTLDCKFHIVCVICDFLLNEMCYLWGI